MSLPSDNIENHVKSIMGSRRAKGKAVILCEGDIDSVKNVGVNPSMYGKLEKMPDANFYRACLPKEARTRKTPVFFPCGSRSDVIKVFSRLHDSLATEKDAYVDAGKLFAIVDLDIQKSTIENYKFSDTEEIFFDLYKGTAINHATKEHHKIFVTGLIHKEAYFLLPELQGLFNNYKNPVLYKDSKINLRTLYDEIIGDSSADQDLNQNPDIVLKRMGFLNLNVCSVSDLCASIKSEYRDKDILKFAKIIFLFRKAKPYWENTYIDPDFSLSAEKFREQLSLEIAKIYSDENNGDFHLTAILKSIYKQAYGIKITK